MKLAVILGSTRPNRKSDRIAHWVVQNARELEGTEVELLDLLDYPLPFFDEPQSPRYNENRPLNEVAKKWLTKLEKFDAYVVVSPEYNHSIPGVLKNALDYTDWQLNRKPAAVVTHGSAGGARAQTHLKLILSEARAVPIPKHVALTMKPADVFDEKGTLSEEVSRQETGPHVNIQALLDELKWYSDALAAARHAS